MAGRNPTFASNNYYHVANFGIDNRLVFNDEKDVLRFIDLLRYYRVKNPPVRFAFRKRPQARENNDKPIPMVEILAYCLMPNHFHLLLRQLVDGGINNFMSKISNSYTKFYNARQKRSGTLFKGSFKAREIPVNKLSDVSRHIHLDPQLAGLVRFLSSFPFSSFPEYLGEKTGFCQKDQILNQFESADEYKEFVMDQDEYHSTLPQIKDLLLE